MFPKSAEGLPSTSLDLDTCLRSLEGAFGFSEPLESCPEKPTLT